MNQVSEKSDKDIVKLQIQKRIDNYDHYNVVALEDNQPNRFIGFIGLDSSKIAVQRCGRCYKSNYILAVLSGLCCHCGWDANDKTQATIAEDLR